MLRRGEDRPLRQDDRGMSIDVARDGHAQPSASMPDEARGKEIYVKGVSPSGTEISAVLDGSGTMVPASVLRCVNCHGHDGIGKPEGGIEPPTITWEELTTPYGASHPGGRQRPAYSKHLLSRAISMGLDSGGNPLSRAMPRYRLSHQDLADLLAYLERLGRERDPGISETELRIGVALPPRRLFEMQGAMKAVLSAFFDELNQAGGIYSRRIEIEYSDGLQSPSDPVTFLRNAAVFTQLAPFVAGVEDEFVSVAADLDVPVVGPLTLYPQTESPLNRHVFYVHSGVSDQAMALAAFAAAGQPRERPSAAILYSDELHATKAASAVEIELTRLGWGRIEKVCVSATFNVQDAATRLSNLGVDVVLNLAGSHFVKALLQAAERLDWRPMLFIPGSLAGSEIFQVPASSDGRILVSLPFLSTSESRLLDKLTSKHQLPATHRGTQREVLSAAVIMVEGLKRAGRYLSRERFIEQLQGLYEFTDGVDRPVTYGPNRRIGAPGAYVARVDLRNKGLVSVSDWIDPTEDEVSGHLEKTLGRPP
jgi:ABC-type branched-subunit amino acid transport system substrate-binding protein